MLNYTYYLFQSALDKKTCEKIISYGNEKIEKQVLLNYDVSGKTRDNNSKTDVINGKPQNSKTVEQLVKNKKNKLSESYHRDSTITGLNDVWIYELIMPFLYEANSKAGWNFEVDYTEALQFTVYNKKQFYGWHIDGGFDSYSSYVKDTPLNKNLKNPKTTDDFMVGKNRKLSMTISLSDPEDYKGGNLNFDLGPHSEKRFVECKEIKKQGSIVVFPSFVHHQITPVTKGTRYSLVSWTLGKPFK
jgi:PKHD-type hydroxylase